MGRKGFWVKVRIRVRIISLRGFMFLFLGFCREFSNSWWFVPTLEVPMYGFTVGHSAFSMIL